LNPRPLPTVLMSQPYDRRQSYLEAMLTPLISLRKQFPGHKEPM
jgi:hypothetical protein